MQKRQVKLFTLTDSNLIKVKNLKIGSAKMGYLVRPIQVIKHADQQTGQEVPGTSGELLGDNENQSDDDTVTF